MGMKIREFVYNPDIIGLRLGIGEMVTELCFKGLKLISPIVLNLSWRKNFGSNDYYCVFRYLKLIQPIY